MRTTFLTAATVALISPAALAQDAGGLLSPAVAPGPFPAAASTVRQRAAALDVAAMEALEPATGGALTLNFFDDATFRARFDRHEEHANGAVTWIGSIEGDEEGWFLVGLSNGQALVNLWTGDGRVFNIRPFSEQGPYLVREVNASGLRGCGGELIPGVDHAGHEHLDPDAGEVPGGWPAGGGGPGTRSCEDSGAQIDVLIASTPLAAVAAGGAWIMPAYYASCIASTNNAYERSGISTRLRLVDGHPTLYVEAPDMGTDLDRLRDTDDGHMDELHILRAQSRADMVALLVASPDSGACGIAYLMTILSTGFAGSAFSVSDVACALDNLTFAHELGHNLGCAHDPDNSNGGLYPYSFGYRFFGFDFNVYRTIMAYAPGARVPYFSNPLVRYQGIFPTGTADANNALTINNVASTAANFRSSGDVLITDQPNDATRNVFQSVSFQAAGEGAGTLAYRWQRNGVDLADGGRIIGAATSRLTINALTRADAGAYRCIISNACDSTNTRAATLTVRCPVDFDNSGTLTLADFVAFRNAYVAGSPAADFNGDGSLTLADFVAFRNSYTAGCP